MPQIKEYTSTEALQGIRPSELGIQAEAQAAWRIGRFYNQTAEDVRRTAGEIGVATRDVGNTVLEHMARDETAKQTTWASDVTLNSLKGMTSIIADPNEPNYEAKSQQYLAGVNELFENMKGNAQTSIGRDHIQKLQESVTEHLGHIRAADISTRAGEDALRNLNATHNNISQMVMDNPDDATLELGLAMAKQSSSQQFSGISVEGSAKIQDFNARQTKELIGASLTARIKADPDKGVADIAKYESQLGPKETEQLQKYGEYWKRQKIEDNERQHRVELQQKKDLSDANASKLVGAAMAGRLSSQSVASMAEKGQLEWPVALELMRANNSFGKEEGKEKVVHTAAVNELSSKIENGDDDARIAIDKAHLADRISTKEYTELRQYAGDTIGIEEKYESPTIRRAIDGAREAAAGIKISGVQLPEDEKAAEEVEWAIHKDLQPLLRSGNKEAIDAYFDRNDPKSGVNQRIEQYRNPMTPAQRIQAYSQIMAGEAPTKDVVGSGDTKTGGYTPGQIVGGYKFKGGAWDDEKNWEKQ